MKPSQKLDRAIKKDRKVLSVAAQVYRGNDVSEITKTVHSANASCTSLQQNAGTGKERPEKPCRKRSVRRITDVPQDELLALLDKHFVYDLKAGRMVHRTTRKVASQPTYANGGTYKRRVINFEGLTILEHRAIWLYCKGKLPPSAEGLEIDHINGDATDNHITNLRLVTRGQNQFNAGMRKDNTSGLKGVTQTRSGTFAANISINGKVKYLGAFPTAVEASEAYQKKAQELRGEYVPDYQVAASKAFMRRIA